MCGLLPAAWARQTGPSGEAPSLASRATCAKVRCVHSESGDRSGVRTEVRKRRESSLSNGLDDDDSSCTRILGRRNVLNLALGLGSALLVGRRAEEGTAAAVTTKDTKSSFDEKRLLDQNRRMQKVNGAPVDFPNFIREGTSFNHFRMIISCTTSLSCCIDPLSSGIRSSVETKY